MTIALATIAVLGIAAALLIPAYRKASRSIDALYDQRIFCVWDTKRNRPQKLLRRNAQWCDLSGSVLADQESYRHMTNEERKEWRHGPSGVFVKSLS